MAEEQKQECDHCNELGGYTYDIEDDRVTTDRGTFGSVCAICRKCGEDISEILATYEHKED